MELLPPQWREEHIVNLFKRGFSVKWLVECLDKDRVMHEGQAGFRLKRSNAYTLNELVQGRIRQRMHSF